MPLAQQRYRASGLNLVTAAVVLWNTVYLERAAHTLRGNGHAVDETLLQYLSPLGWEHINLTGDDLWRSSAKVGARASSGRYARSPGLSVRFFPFSEATPLRTRIASQGLISGPSNRNHLKHPPFSSLEVRNSSDSGDRET